MHQYVKKDYFPIKECLEICIANGAKLSTAILHKRNGSFMLSLKLYFDLINEECDPMAMFQEMPYVYQKHDKFLLRTELDKKLSHYEFPLSKDYPHLNHFDVLL